MRGLPEGMSTYQLRSAFEKAAANIACDECLTMLQGRIEEVVQEWSSVKVNRFYWFVCLALSDIFHIRERFERRTLVLQALHGIH